MVGLSSGFLILSLYVHMYFLAIGYFLACMGMLLKNKTYSNIALISMGVVFIVNDYLTKEYTWFWFMIAILITFISMLYMDYKLMQKLKQLENKIS